MKLFKILNQNKLKKVKILKKNILRKILTLLKEKTVKHYKVLYLNKSLNFVLSNKNNLENEDKLFKN